MDQQLPDGPGIGDVGYEAHSRCQVAGILTRLSTFCPVHALEPPALSASIGFHCSQANLFDGSCGGKSRAPGREFIFFQLFTCAGDD
jgi:hypothetical protein